MLRQDISHHVAATAKAGLLSAGIVFLVSLGLYLLVAYFSLIVDVAWHAFVWTWEGLLQAATLNHREALETLSILGAVSAWLYFTSYFLYRKNTSSASVFHVGFRCSAVWLCFSALVYLWSSGLGPGNIFAGTLAIFVFGLLGFNFMDLFLDFYDEHGRSNGSESNDQQPMGESTTNLEESWEQRFARQAAERKRQSQG